MDNGWEKMLMADVVYYTSMSLEGMRGGRGRETSNRTAIFRLSCETEITLHAGGA
jgi:hypothetical protein